MTKPIIAVFGSGLCQPGSADYEFARRLGRAIAARGWTLCNGGYGGTMEAGARGALEGGGHTIGVTCRILDWPEPNEAILQEVPTFDLMARLNTLMRLAAGYVVLPGGTGTLLELALVWEFINKRMISPRPIVLLGRLWQSLAPALMREQPASVVPVCAESIDAAIAALAAGMPGQDPGASPS